jgi:hypothetical protein
MATPLSAMTAAVAQPAAVACLSFSALHSPLLPPLACLPDAPPTVLELPATSGHTAAHVAMAKAPAAAASVNGQLAATSLHETRGATPAMLDAAVAEMERILTTAGMPVAHGPRAVGPAAGTACARVAPIAADSPPVAEGGMRCELELECGPVGASGLQVGQAEAELAPGSASMAGAGPCSAADLLLSSQGAAGPGPCGAADLLLSIARGASRHAGAVA